MESELLQAYRLILDANEVALRRGDKYGLCDDIDNEGNPYPSQWRTDIIERARVAVNKADNLIDINQLLRRHFISVVRIE